MFSIFKVRSITLLFFYAKFNFGKFDSSFEMHWNIMFKISYFCRLWARRCALLTSKREFLRFEVEHKGTHRRGIFRVKKHVSFIRSISWKFELIPFCGWRALALRNLSSFRLTIFAQTQNFWLTQIQSLKSFLWMYTSKKELNDI